MLACPDIKPSFPLTSINDIQISKLGELELKTTLDPGSLKNPSSQEGQFNMFFWQFSL